LKEIAKVKGGNSPSSKASIDLIIMDGQLRISSEAIADAIGTTYKSTKNLIKVHREALESG